MPRWHIFFFFPLFADIFCVCFLLRWVSFGITTSARRKERLIDNYERARQVGRPAAEHGWRASALGLVSSLRVAGGVAAARRQCCSPVCRRWRRILSHHIGGGIGGIKRWHSAISAIARTAGGVHGKSIGIAALSYRDGALRPFIKRNGKNIVLA